MDGDRPDDERRDAALEVPLGPVGGGSDGRRRAVVVLSAGVAIVAVAFALAALPPKDRPAPSDETALLGVPLPAFLPSPSRPIPSPSAPGPRPSSSRHEALPQLANEALAHAPNPVLVERLGDDARLVAWNPGDPLRVVRTFRNAFTAETQYAYVSPDGASLVVATFEAGDTEAQDIARLLTNDGRVVWESDGITTSGGIVWSSDSRKVALLGGHGTWWVVTLDATGTALSQRIDVGDKHAAAPTLSPGALPSTTPSSSRAALVPVGFSADGRWLYGAPFPGYGGSTRPTIRVSIPGGIVEPISGAAIGGPARIGRVDGLGGLDPRTGRAIRWGPSASVPGGPPILEVTKPDGSIAYRVEVRIVLGAAWEATGELVILEADGFPYPTRLRLLPIAPDGTIGRPILSTGSVAWGGLLGVRNGFAAMALETRQPTDGRQLVMVDLADGKAAGLTLPADTGGLVGSGLLP
jgi:hypothetical protein